MSNLPIYRGVDIKTGEVFIGTSMLRDVWGNVHLIDEIRNGFNWDMCHSVFPDSFEISFDNGKSFIKSKDLEIHTCTDFSLIYSDMKMRKKKNIQPPNGDIFTILTDKGR